MPYPVITQSDFTLTTAGPIRHCTLPSGVQLPVMLDGTATPDPNGLLPPVRTEDKRLVYALPGGRRWVQR